MIPQEPTVPAIAGPALQDRRGRDADHASARVDGRVDDRLQVRIDLQPRDRDETANVAGK